MKKTIFICFVTAVLGITAGFFIVSKLGKNYSPSEPSWETSMRVLVDPRSLFGGKDTITILILGTDYNYTNRDIMFTKNTRSDTMILARLNLDKKTLKLLSIPRDTRVNIPGDGWDRINSAYAIGGTKLAENVVKSILNVPIDYGVRIKEQGLKSLVEAMGGVDVNVEKNMNYDDNWGHFHVHLKKGPQHLNGEQAAGYSRFRHDEEGDYGRIRRQQQVIKAIQQRLTSPLVLADLEKIVNVARANVETDLTFSQLLALGNLMKGTAMTSVKPLTLPTIPKDYKEGGYWVSYVEIDEAEARKVLAEFESDETQTATSALRVEVLNGSGIQNKAQSVAELLKAKGYFVTHVGNADRSDYSQTQIVDHTGQGQAGSIAKILPYATTMSLPQEGERQTDLTVIVGRD